jgi:hypothetical protein|tara:strand:- start:730 stop:930 length:201 start_codon:yes stop_codon:yes gene_type:complete
MDMKSAPTVKNMGGAAAVNTNVKVAGTSSEKKHPTASFKGAGGNVVTSRAPANYKAGKGNSKGTKY